MKMGVLPNVEIETPTAKMSFEDFKMWFRSYSSSQSRPRTDRGWDYYNDKIKAKLELVDTKET